MLIDNVATLAAQVALRGHRLNDAVRVATIDIDNDLNVGGSVGRFDPNSGALNPHAGLYRPTLLGTSTQRDAKGTPLSWCELLHRATLSLTRQRCTGHRKADGNGRDDASGYWDTQQRAAYPAHIDEAVVWDALADTLLDRHVRKATETPAITDHDLTQERPSPCTAQAVIGLSRVELARRASNQRDVVTGKDPARVTVTEFVLDTDHGTLTTAKVRKYAKHHDADVALGDVAQHDVSLVALEHREEVAACIAELPDSLRMTALNAVNGGGIPDSVPRNVYYKRIQRMREALAVKFRARGLMKADKN